MSQLILSLAMHGFDFSHPVQEADIAQQCVREYDEAGYGSQNSALRESREDVDREDIPHPPKASKTQLVDIPTDAAEAKRSSRKKKRERRRRGASKNRDLTRSLAEAEH